MAKIIGDTTATPNPRPDWNQTDETKADFIKNKPNINETFSNALTGSATGEAIVLDDVSPVTHKLGAKVSSKNLFVISRDEVVDKSGITITSTAGESKFKVTAKDITAAASSNSFYFDLEAGTYTVSIIGTKIDNDYVYIQNRTTGSYYINARRNSASTFTLTEKTRIIIGFVVYFDTTRTYDNDDILIQLERGSKATEWRPCVEDIEAVKVKRYGRNMLDVANAKMIATKLSTQLKKERTETGIKMTCLADISGYIRSGFRIGSTEEMRGKTYTVSFEDMTSSLTDKPNGISIYIYNDDDRQQSYIDDGYVGNDNYFKTLTASTEQSLTFTIPADVDTSFTNVGIMFDFNRGRAISVGDVVEYKDIMLEVNEGGGAYEPYTEPTEHSTAADGTVEGITSTYPTTTLATDTIGAVIDCQYNKDINKAFTELYNAIISLGGNV